MFYVDIEFKKPVRLSYNTVAERNAAFTKMLQFLRNNGITVQDCIIKRTDSIVFQSISDATIKKTLEHIVEIQ